MKRAAGFTLIELVIVIVILGILGAVAAPRFLNLQGDAYGANLDGLKNSMESAVTLANTKAILGGYDKKDGVVGTDITPNNGDESLDGVEFKDGYPAATEDGIMNPILIEYKDTDFTVDTSTENEVHVSPKARETDTGGALDTCAVIYKEKADSRPEITVVKSGC